MDQLWEALAGLSQPWATLIGGFIVGLGAFLGFRASLMTHNREVMSARQDRYTTIAEQLASENEPVRLAGAYALAALAEEWQEARGFGQRDVAVKLLCAYLRAKPRTSINNKTPDNKDREVRTAMVSIIRQNARRIDWSTSSLPSPGSRLVALSPWVRRLRRRTWGGPIIDLSGAYLIDANFKEVNLSSATCVGSDLKGANLQWADLKDANLKDANLAHATMMFARLNGAYLAGADLRKASLQWVQAGELTFHLMVTRVNLEGANLEGARLLGADLLGANMERANLKGVELEVAKLGKVNLVGANLEKANLKETDLEEADLAGANLAGANLAGANLAGANLAGANLDGANLAGANLAGASLDGANLDGGFTSKTDLSQAGGLSHGDMPGGPSGAPE